MPRKDSLLPRDIYDSPWKEAILRFLPELFALLYPAAHAEIDWTRPPEPLDGELRKVVREAKTGDQRADLLFKVYLRDGSERFVLAHIEVQTTEDRELTDRLFRYCYRIYDRHQHFVAAFVVLGDEHPQWRPDQFSWDALGSRLSWEFQTAKLLDWETRWAELEASSNPFATIVMAHLKTKRTREDPENRREWKLRITKHIYDHHQAEDAQELLRLVDWLMHLPEEQAIIYEDEVAALAAEKQMNYIPSFARKSWNEGLAQGRSEGLVEGRTEGRAESRALLARLLEKRFGPLPASVANLLQTADGDAMERWGLRLLDSATLDEVFAAPVVTAPAPKSRRRPAHP